VSSPLARSRFRPRLRSLPGIGRFFVWLSVGYQRRRAELSTAGTSLRTTRLPATRDAAAVAVGRSLAEGGRRLLLSPYRQERVELPAPLAAGEHRFDVVEDLVEFTSLPPETVRTLLERRIENFRTEWLQLPAELRDDRWFYLTSRTYLFANAVHFHASSELVGEIAALLPSGARVLDFGGGTGNLALGLAACGLRVEFRELSALQKDFTRFRLQRYGLEDRVEILDAWQPLAPARYDAVCAFDVLEHLPDLPGALDEIAGSLVAGGLLLDTPSFGVGLANPMHHEDPGLEGLLASRGIFLERTLPDFRVWTKGSPVRQGQLDSPDLEALVRSIAERETQDHDRELVVVEVGSGGGRGSTVAIERALTACGRPFQLIGYEGNAELARLASEHWHDAPHVRIVNEYFMQRGDIAAAVKPRVAESDRDAYLPEFDAIATAENFLSTPPPGPIDLLFVDSVRYTHLAILRAATPWLRPGTVVLMEDDIPEYGELGIVESELEVRDVAKHESGGQWPFVEFRVAVP
jgi:SAM-dependent methyltransferase/predicted O-methyltransferase YrrM